jgi:DNA-binding NtrC family response regulator
LRYLVDYNWNGNVRELKQTVNLLSHIAMGKKRINISDVKSILNHKENKSNGYEFYSTEKIKILKEFEIDYFTKLLKKYSGNMTQAAKASGMYRPNLVKKLKNLGISSSDFK